MLVIACHDFVLGVRGYNPGCRAIDVLAGDHQVEHQEEGDEREYLLCLAFEQFPQWVMFPSLLKHSYLPLVLHLPPGLEVNLHFDESLLSLEFAHDVEGSADENGPICGFEAEDEL